VPPADRRVASGVEGTVAPLGHISALDGLRGVAIALVVTYHYWGWPRGGWLGVDLFFVLSGFLITTLLLEEHTANGRIRFGAFYVRRVRRLFPALAVLLAAYLAINAVRGIDALGLVARWGLYTANVYEAFWPGVADHHVGLNPLWSLAQEEQFYLVWPAALLLAVKVRRPARFLIAIALALALYRAALVLHGESGFRVYFAPDTHADGLVLGSALAFARQKGGELVPTRTAVVVTAALCAPFVAFSVSVPRTQMIILPLFEAAALVFVAAAVAGTFDLPRPVIWLGGISYSLYLWHALLLWVFHDRHRVVALAASVAIAYASTKWVERPFRRRRATAVRAARPSVVPAEAG
jgi:peptidoglycan/LPS O-acetylase OafA/YrhL